MPGRTLDRVKGYDLDVLFVDDNSPDRSAEVARKISLDNNRARMIADRGPANACIQGLLSAKGDIPGLLDPIRRGKYDIVGAARTLDGAFAAWQFATFLLSNLTRGIVPARLISFLAVGGSGVLVHMAVLLASMSLTNSFAFSQLAGAMTAATSNYLLNNQLTFRDQRLRGVKLFTRYLEFLVISSVGVAANVAMATYTYNAMAGVALLAAFSGIALDTAWKYAVSSRFVWR